MGRCSEVRLGRRSAQGRHSASPLAPAWGTGARAAQSACRFRPLLSLSDLDSRGNFARRGWDEFDVQVGVPSATDFACLRSSPEGCLDVQSFVLQCVHLITNFPMIRRTKSCAWRQKSVSVRTAYAKEDESTRFRSAPQTTRDLRASARRHPHQHTTCALGARSNAVEANRVMKQCVLRQTSLVDAPLKQVRLFP